MENKVVCEIFKILSDYTKKLVLFTCYDVTRELRNRNFVVFHGDVKNVVHAFFEAGGQFSGTYVRNNGVPIHNLYGVFAEVYGPSGYDASKYDHKGLDPSNPVKIVPSANKQQTTPIAPVSNGFSTVMNTTAAPGTQTVSSSNVAILKQPKTHYQVVHRKKNGRLGIRSKLLKLAGFSKNTTVYVAQRAYNGHGFVILKNPPKTGQYTYYNLDDHLNFKISNGFLKKCGVGDVTSFTLRTTDSMDGIVGIEL